MILHALTALLLILLALALFSAAWSLLAGRRHPPTGAFATVNGTRLHFRHRSGPEGKPTVVFLHGASGNLRDQDAVLGGPVSAFTPTLAVDRPGHGWSERGPASNSAPDGQAATLSALLDHLGIERAILVGHSFGATLAATFAVLYPERTAGLVFLAPASHPWPRGETSWYYVVTALPLIGRLFAATLAVPGGLMRIRSATACVFAPNPVPEGYLETAAIPLVLRPRHFHANAEDVDGLYRFVTRFSPRYREIAAPTVVVSGNRDTVVYEEIHAVGLARDIPGARLVWVDNLGHKPDWVAPDLVLAAIRSVAGDHAVDLDATARAVELRIAGDCFGAGCVDPGPAEGAPELSVSG